MRRRLRLKRGVRHGLTELATILEHRLFNLSEVRAFRLFDPIQKLVNGGFGLG